MKKLMILMVMLMALPMAFAQDCDYDMTGITGRVYSGNDISTPVVEGANVEVTCNTYVETDVTDASGEYGVGFYDNVCPIGSNVTSCVGTNCATDVVSECLMDQFNLLNINIFDVPEFGAIGAAIALAGAGAIALKRRK